MRLEITGDDLLDAGVAPGPEIGMRLEAALACKLDGQLAGQDGARGAEGGPRSGLVTAWGRNRWAHESCATSSRGAPRCCSPIALMAASPCPGGRATALPRPSSASACWPWRAPTALARGRQVHGSTVRRIARGAPAGDGEGSPSRERADGQGPPGLEPADGQATSLKGLAVMVVSADCLPVTVAGEGAVAMLHCGWRGLAAGVLEEGVARRTGARDGTRGRCRR